MPLQGFCGSIVRFPGGNVRSLDLCCAFPRKGSFGHVTMAIWQSQCFNQTRMAIITCTLVMSQVSMYQLITATQAMFEGPLTLIFAIANSPQKIDIHRRSIKLNLWVAGVLHITCISFHKSSVVR